MGGEREGQAAGLSFHLPGEPLRRTVGALYPTWAGALRLPAGTWGRWMEWAWAGGGGSGAALSLSVN